MDTESCVRQVADWSSHGLLGEIDWKTCVWSVCKNTGGSHRL